MNSNIPTPVIHILPWNGHKSALSLTFDDGVPAHLDLVIPELDKRGLKGTFYVVAGGLMDTDRWKKACSEGHEIGNHSMNHKRVKDLLPGEGQVQVTEAKKKLENLLHVPVTTFAYPFTEISPELRKAVESHHLLGRGGNRGAFYLDPNSEPDWMDLPSQVALSEMGSDVYEGWITEVQKREAWTVFQLHGIEGSPPGWQPLPRSVFFRLLDELKENRDRIWIAPFGEVGAYWRAQKILENSLSQAAPSSGRFTWKKDSRFPDGIRLKCRISRPETQASQKDSPLTSLADGVHLLDFDAGELTLHD